MNNSWKRARTFLVALSLALLVGSAFLLWRYFGENSGRTQRQHAQAVAKARAELAKFGSLGQNEDHSADSGNVPPEAFSQMQNEKHALRELVRAVLNSEPPTASSEQLHHSVADALAKSGVRIQDQSSTDDPKEPMFGRITLQIERVLGHKDLVAAKVGLSIPCGTDGALYLYQQTGSVWNRILSYEAPPYQKLTGAFGGLDYSISPGAGRNWYVLVASYTPWCTSAWQGIRYAVLRPKADTDAPQVVLNVNDGIYLGGDQLWKLRTDPDTAQVTWTSSFSLDAGILVRQHVARYRIDQSSATRVPPVALYPEDFVDEWSQRPWDEAKEWTAPEALDDAQAIHKWLHDSKFYTNTEFLQSCPIPDHWQLGFTIEGENDQKPPLQHLYFDVSSDGDVFRLDRIAGTRAPGCPGTDLLPQRTH